MFIALESYYGKFSVAKKPMEIILIMKRKFTGSEGSGRRKRKDRKEGAIFCIVFDVDFEN